MRLRARHYATGSPVDVVTENGRVASVGPPTDATADRIAGWVAPAFFDVQINGCDGVSFNSASLTADRVRHVAAVCRRQRVTRFCPTLITNALKPLAHGFAHLGRP